MAISHCYWYLVVKTKNFTLLLTYRGQECQFHIATDIHWTRMAISHCYWQLVVKNGNFTLLLTSCGQDWQFHIASDIYWSNLLDEPSSSDVPSSTSGEMPWIPVQKYVPGEPTLADGPPTCWMAILHCYLHLVVNDDNFTLLLNLVVKNGNFTLVLTSSGQEWQFHLATYI